MNSTIKRLPLFFSISAAASLALLVVYQGDVIAKLRTALQQTSSKLTQTEEALRQEMESSESLRQELMILQDSIEMLHLHIARLDDLVSEQKVIIRKLSATIKKQENKVSRLTREINQLLRSSRGSEEKINALTRERDEVLKQMEALDNERIAAENKRREQEQMQKDHQEKLDKIETKSEQTREQLNLIIPLTAPQPVIRQTPAESPVTLSSPVNDPAPQTAPEPAINQSPASQPVTKANTNDDMAQYIKSKHQEKLRNVVANTAARFTAIALKSRDNTNNLKKVKEDGWFYTYIDFDLENTDRDAILDETFIVQVFDLDNQEVVPMNEKNPVFPNSETGAHGLNFRYEGKPVSIRYFNTEKKEGLNYEVRLLYYKNGLTYELMNGRKKIVENGLVIAP